MLKIGLTGGIGSGKTTIANLFAELNVPVIDADEIAREVVAPGSQALEQIRHAFSERVIADDGSLDRSAMRELIFADTEQKRKLEAIVHPKVRQSILKRVASLDASYCIICVPLLVESSMANLVDRVLVVDCPVETQIERVAKRDRLDEKIVRAIIDSQATREQRKALANDLIGNTSSDSMLAEQVKKLHNLYLYLSKRQDF
ncbi:dephospho-CoA kinase [Methylotuvimicrobium alcaliphilum]|uniref:Dephospho-CoA kinase n=2 Tax=Methylotuvimicrobium alcaliphilum TaxID=271065 RepID=G4T0U7_META2|nr:dephospho-CoA kinase [Methylotuvimicrobium alcaliphilum]CCE22376.1 dephospho-CoA kinase [Methylotuvimicrobium alcaliphilum 20Z]